MVKHFGIPKHRMKRQMTKNADGGYNSSLKSHTGYPHPATPRTRDY